MLNSNVDEAGCRVVYVSDAPMGATRAQMLFEDYPDLLTPAHLSEITGQCEATIRSLCGRGKPCGGAEGATRGGPGDRRKKFETGEKKCLTKAMKCGNLIKLSARAAASH